MQGRTLQRLTHFTLTDKRQFSTVIDGVRRADFCLVSEEHELGVHALAVPLRNARGATIAALNVVIASGHVAQQGFPGDLLETLREAARELRPLL